MTHFLSLLTDWNQVKRWGEKKGHKHTLELDWALHLVAVWLDVDSASSLFSRHVQDVLWHRKPYLKVDGRAGSSPVQEGGDGCLCSSCQRESECRQSDPARHIWCFSSPLSAPATCLQVSVSAAWAAHVKLKVNSVTQAPLAKHPILSPSPASIRTP